MNKIKVAGKEFPVVFSHFNLGTRKMEDSKNDGQATIALIKDEVSLHYGISFCSPNDMFSKQKGRSQAIKRLHVHMIRRRNGLSQSKFAGTINSSADGDRFKKDHFDICLDIVYDEIKKSGSPGWANGRLVVFRPSKKKSDNQQ